MKFTKLTKCCIAICLGLLLCSVAGTAYAQSGRGQSNSSSKTRSTSPTKETRSASPPVDSSRLPTPPSEAILEDVKTKAEDAQKTLSEIETLSKGVNEALEAAVASAAEATEGSTIELVLESFQKSKSLVKNAKSDLEKIATRSDQIEQTLSNVTDIARTHTPSEEIKKYQQFINSYMEKSKKETEKIEILYEDSKNSIKDIELSSLVQLISKTNQKIFSELDEKSLELYKDIRIYFIIMAIFIIIYLFYMDRKFASIDRYISRMIGEERSAQEVNKEEMIFLQKNMRGDFSKLSSKIENSLLLNREYEGKISSIEYSINNINNYVLSKLDSISEKSYQSQESLENNMDLLRNMDKYYEYEISSSRSYLSKTKEELEHIKNERANLEKSLENTQRQLDRSESDIVNICQNIMKKNGYHIVESFPRKAIYLLYCDDFEKQPDEHIDYCKRLYRLRFLLEKEYDSDRLPYFYKACGIKELREDMLGRQEYKVPLQEDIQSYFILEWNHLSRIFRTAILLQTYWPDHDVALLTELHYACASIRSVLLKYHIYPHVFNLLEEPQNYPQHIVPQLAPLPTVLEKNRDFQNRVRPLTEHQNTYCDVYEWGYEVQQGQKPSIDSKLTVKQQGAHWEQPEEL